MLNVLLFYIIHSIILFHIRYKELYFLVKTFDQIMLKGPTCTHDLSSKSLSLFLGVGIIIDSSNMNISY